MRHPAQHTHDWRSEEYAREWVMNAEARDHERAAGLNLLPRLIPQPPDTPLRVLDLGAGYGIVTATVLAAFPRAQVTLLDFSDAMLSHARARLAPHAGQLRYVHGDLSAPGWEPAPAHSFDAVVSAAAFHNLRDPARMAALFREIAAVLVPGGAFLNLDHVSAGGPRLQDQIARARGRPRHRHATADETRSSALRFPAGLVTQLGWLQAAGFAEVDCLWKHLDLALYGGYLP
jgi:tRNA (cmo5U34)-methyltransferase